MNRAGTKKALPLPEGLFENSLKNGSLLFNPPNLYHPVGAAIGF